MNALPGIRAAAGCAIIGSEQLTKSPPDGYTIMTANIAHGANPGELNGHSETSALSAKHQRIRGASQWSADTRQASPAE